MAMAALLMNLIILLLLAISSQSMAFSVLNIRLQKKLSTRLFSFSSKPSVSIPIPRAAVAIVVRYADVESSSPWWLLVQRGKEPNKGMWSIPGGSIEAGENTLDAAKRELQEETGLRDDASMPYQLKWHSFGSFASSDSIHLPTESSKGFHYVISQCFAEVDGEPNIQAGDDAIDAKWFSASSVREAEDNGTVSRGVWRILERSELLYTKGLLDTE